MSEKTETTRTVRSNRLKTGAEMLRSLIEKGKKNKRTVFLVLWALSVAALFVVFRMDAHNTYDYQAFKTDYTKQAEEKVVSDDENINGVYLYGPYIDLRKGKYEFDVHYEADTDYPYEVTCRMAKEKLKEGTLGANKSRTTFTLTVPENIDDQSVEFRTYYEGKGNFTFHSLEIRRLGWIRDAIILMLLMTAAAACILFFYGDWSPVCMLYIGAFYAAAGPSLSRNLIVCLAGTVLHIAWLFLVLRIPRIRQEIRKAEPYEGLLLLLASFLIVSGVNVIRYPGGVEKLDFVRKIVTEQYILGLLAAFHLLVLVRLFSRARRSSSWILLTSAVFFGFTCILNYRNVYFTIGVTAILGFFIYYLLRSDQDMLQWASGVRSYRRCFYVVVALSLLMAGYFTVITVCRYRAFNSANFDMGIFCQMYEYMARTGLPLTTTERGYLLSHFYIHFSPIFYLFLPIYMVFRSPECLLVIQALMVFLAAVPLFLICRHFRLKPFITTLVCCLYLVLPATQEPLFYDFHEYKFIPFFMFWFLYFYLENRNVRALFFLILTLMIKEDIAIYLIVFALYRIIVEKDYKRGSIVLAISGIYFAGVMMFIQSHGLGLMEGHYKMYYLPGERGVFALAKNIILQPGRFVRQVFDEENIPYIFYTLGVFLFVPLGSKDFRRLILLLPYVAFGLMTDYEYQHDVGFQYVYGPVVLILLLFLLNLREMEEQKQLFICLTCICAGILMCYTYKGDGYTRYIRKYRENREALDERDAFLKDYYTEASVTVDSFLAPHLSHLPDLHDYDVKFPDTEYYILYTSGDYKFKEVYEEMGYEVIDEQHGMTFYQKTEDGSAKDSKED